MRGYASYCQLLRSYRPLLWCRCGWATLANWRGRSGWRFYSNLFTTCSVKEGGGIYSFHISLSPHHTTRKHRSLRCACSEPRLEAASPTQILEEGWMNWSSAGALTAHTCFLSGCTCSVGPLGSAVCLHNCCMDWAIPHQTPSSISDGLNLTTSAIFNPQPVREPESQS